MPATAHYPSTLLAALLALLIFVAPAHPQGFRIPSLPDNPPANNNNNNNPQAHKTPPVIKPGARLIYNATAQQTNPNAPQPQNLASRGYNVYDIAAVTPNALLVNARVYQPVPQGQLGQPGQQYLVAQSSQVIDLSQPGGNTLFYPADQLAQLQSSPGLTVERGGTLEVNGTTYKTVVVAQQHQQTISRTVYDQATGLKLTSVRQTGNPNTPFNQRARSGDSEQLVAVRQRSLPWLNEPADAWLGNAKQLHYDIRIWIAGIELSQDRPDQRVQITQAGPNWATGQHISIKNGQRYDQGNRVLLVDGPGQNLSLWVNPKALAKLKPGTIDQDPVLNTTLTYQVQDGKLGRLGVFVETDPNQTSIRVHGHNLETGLLTFQQITDRGNRDNRSMIITAQLTGVQ